MATAQVGLWCLPIGGCWSDLVGSGSALGLFKLKLWFEPEATMIINQRYFYC